MATVTSFRDIRAWQNAMQLAVDVYRLTVDLPPTERPGLITELQRVAGVIPSNIASGHKTGSRSGMLNSCDEAQVNCNHLETLLIITGQLYPKVPTNDLLDQLEEVQQMLEIIIKKLTTAKPAPRKAI